MPTVLLLMAESGAAIAFLVLALRFNSPWLGVCLLLKGLQLALDGIHLTDGADPVLYGFNLYAVGMNAISLLFLATFVGAISAEKKQPRFSPGEVQTA